MQAVVHVSLKRTVLDPQGRTICSALNGLGHKEVVDVRQGKYFEIELADGTPDDEARRKIEAIAHDVLANPVIEEYRIEIRD